MGLTLVGSDAALTAELVALTLGYRELRFIGCSGRYLTQPHFGGYPARTYSPKQAERAQVRGLRAKVAVAVQLRRRGITFEGI